MTGTGENLLSIRDLSVAFGQGAREVLAVDRVSFDIGKGETVALVGESRLRKIGHRAVGDEALALSGGVAIRPARSCSRVASF